MRGRPGSGSARGPSSEGWVIPPGPAFADLTWRVSVKFPAGLTWTFPTFESEFPFHVAERDYLVQSFQMQGTQLEKKDFELSKGYCILLSCFTFVCVPSLQARVHVGLHHEVHTEVGGGDLQHLCLPVSPLFEPLGVCAAYCRKCPWSDER